MNENLRERIKVLLDEHRMNQGELATRAELSKATISGLLSGRKENVKLSTIEKIAKVLGCQVEIHLENVGFSC